jgi:hypothetical protein
MKLQQWAHWAEIVSSVAVVVTLVFLIQQVRGNTQALERRATLDRVSAVNAPFFSAPELASVLARIKSVDGALPGPRSYAERYGLTDEEAILWDRHLTLLWMGLEADFRHSGGTGEIAAWVRDLLASGDNRLYWEANSSWHGAGFRAFVDAVAAEG